MVEQSQTPAQQAYDISNMSYAQVSGKHPNANDKKLNDFVFMGIPTQVMNTTEFKLDKDGNPEYTYIENYIAFNPIYDYLQDMKKKDNNFKCISAKPTDWDRIQTNTSNQTRVCIDSEEKVKKQISFRELPNRQYPLKISFKGGDIKKMKNSDQGTYFHPLLAPYVLKWLSSTWYDKFAEESIEFYIKFQNLFRETNTFISNVRSSALSKEIQDSLLTSKKNELEQQDSTQFKKDIEMLLDAIKNVDIHLNVKNENCEFIQAVRRDEISPQVQEVISNQPEVDNNLVVANLMKQLAEFKQREEQKEKELADANAKVESERIAKEETAKQLAESKQREEEAKQQAENERKAKEQVEKENKRLKEQEENITQELKSVKNDKAELLKKIKKVYGDLYLLRIKPSILPKIDEQHKQFVQLLMNYLKYLGLADRKSLQPFLERFKEHLDEFKTCESNDVNKAIIFCAAKLLINKMLKDPAETLDYDDIIESVRLNDEPITSDDMLRACEASNINKHKLFLNSVMYTNYRTEEEKQLDKIEKQIKKIENEILNEKLYGIALEIRQKEIQNKTTFTLEYIQKHYCHNMTQDMMTIVQLKMNKARTRKSSIGVQTQLNKSLSKSEEKTKLLTQKMSSKEILYQNAVQKRVTMSSLIDESKITTSSSQQRQDTQPIIEESKEQGQQQIQANRPSNLKTIKELKGEHPQQKKGTRGKSTRPNQHAQDQYIDLSDQRKRIKKDDILDPEMYCEKCKQQFKQLTRFQKHNSTFHSLQ